MKNLAFSRWAKSAWLAPILCMCSIGFTTACSDSEVDYNPSAYINDEAKLSMLHGVKDLEKNKGRIYELNYTADYKLNEALAAQISGLADLQRFAVTHLFDQLPSGKSVQQLSFGANCSAFAATEATNGHFMMGRNYDFCHKNKNGGEDEIAALVIHTAPEGGKRSVSVVDGYWLGYKRGFYVDGNTDLSMLMLAPYAPMDGMNEDGFAIGVLHLDGLPTIQNEENKPTIYLSVAMRMLLDKASTVKEAVELLKQYNMNMESEALGSYHFYMADATGDYAIVEYVDPKGDVDNFHPATLDVLTGSEAWRYTTNFYNSSFMNTSSYGPLLSDHGRKRYNKMKDVIDEANARITAKEAMVLLDSVSQAANTKDLTSHTQWSSLYDLSQRKLTLHLLREYKKKAFTFKIK